MTNEEALTKMQKEPSEKPALSHLAKAVHKKRQCHCSMAMSKSATFPKSENYREHNAPSTVFKAPVAAHSIAAPQAANAVVIACSASFFLQHESEDAAM